MKIQRHSPLNYLKGVIRYCATAPSQRKVHHDEKLPSAWVEQVLGPQREPIRNKRNKYRISRIQQVEQCLTYCHITRVASKCKSEYLLQQQQAEHGRVISD